MSSYVVGDDKKMRLETTIGCGWRRREDVVGDNERVWVETTSGCG